MITAGCKNFKKCEIFFKKALAMSERYDILCNTQTLRGGAVVARQAHNLKAVGSIPAPATK